ncbi:unnamed protein product [Tilletia laevis]|uniref:Uncharacterized protein n=2 Tax=Tilletia TaxID=13289 RepID=A0A177UNZ1_9BASI|nr:hypothetical protein CF336_g2819 [Tilletia laevis]KAE8198351.1 hypothetical protein CF328_g3580 [Tilletia controversa]KAE8261410.1 hypothetical protein A4X03_0g3281 [Tilletia caries]CAD6888175.1 unnamed protein product [Tilletia caries]CAD6905026.1 unnamed protein product [Tilletia laevis]
MSSMRNATLNMPLGGIPGPQTCLIPDIVFLALYNLLLIGLLARFVAASTTLAYIWRPALFTLLRIVVFSLRIWLSTHTTMHVAAARHKFIAQSVLLAAAPLVLLSAVLMLLRDAAEAYRPVDCASAGRKQRIGVLRFLTYSLEFGLLCMGVLFCEAAIEYTDAILGYSDGIKRLQNIWLATSFYFVLAVLVCAAIVLVLSMEYGMGNFYLDRVPHPELEGRKLVQLTALITLLFFAFIYKTLQVEQPRAHVINGTPAFYGGYCLLELLAAASFAVFNYERLMPDPSRSSSPSPQNGGKKSFSATIKARLADLEKGLIFNNRRRTLQSRDLRIVAIKNRAKQNALNASRPSDHDPAGNRTGRASSIFHQRLHRVSKVSVGNQDAPRPQTLHIIPRPVADETLRYNTAAQIRRQKEAENGSSTDESEIFPCTPASAATVPTAQYKHSLSPRSRLRRAISVRSQLEQRQNFGLASPRTRRSVDIARTTRSGTAREGAISSMSRYNSMRGPYPAIRGSMAVNPLTAVLDEPLAAEPEDVAVNDHPSPCTISQKLVDFPRLDKGAEDDGSQSPRLTFDSVPPLRMKRSVRTFGPVSLYDDHNGQGLSNASLCTATVRAPQRAALRIVNGDIAPMRSESSVSTFVSSTSATSSRGKNPGKRRVSSPRFVHREPTRAPSQVRPEKPIRHERRRGSSDSDRSFYYV